MNDLEWCYDKLVKTSRSFAAVIQTLENPLKDATCIFYLTLRALDTVEDDTRYPLPQKIPLLQQFHQKLYQRGWNMDGCGDGDERDLLVHLDRMINVFLGLEEKFQTVISDITKRMGIGMAEFIEGVRKVDSLEDWNIYCHYVAGLVGIGLSGLFAASGKEDPSFAKADDLSNAMGLFLQKTNIIRDYREDIEQNRIFWPSSVWQKYTSKLENFKEDSHATEAVFCLNDLITNAIGHIPQCFEYMSRLRNPAVFNFCAIPQIMAIGTLNACYENRAVFKGVVKMTRKETEEIISTMNGMHSIYYWYYYYINQMIGKINVNDPNRKIMAERLTNARTYIEQKASTWKPPSRL